MSEYHARAKRAIGQLMGRQILMQCITMTGNIVLARTLGPGPFGLYIISLFVVGLFAFLANFGLAPSFVQRKAELTTHDLQVAFTLQQALISAIVVGLFIAAPLLSGWLYPGQPEVVWLVRALSFNLFLNGWRTMSAIQLEREVKFGRLARVEVLEAIVYQGLAVGFSLAGYGTWSLIIAALAQGLLGTILIYAAAPWSVRLRWDWQKSRELIKNGVPFQLQQLMNSIGEWVTPLLVGRQIGPVAVGLLTWASSNGRKPIVLTDNIMRVAFPHFARLQDDRAEVERLVVRYLTVCLLAAGLWFIGLCAVCPAAVQLIYASKWVGGTPALLLYAFVLPLDMTSMMMAITLSGIGAVSASTRAITIRSIANILLTIAMVYALPNISAIVIVPTAYIAVSIVVVPWMITDLGQGALRRVSAALSWIAMPVASATAVGWVAKGLSHRLPLVAEVVFCGMVATLVYTAVAALAAPTWLTAIFRHKWASVCGRPTAA